MNVSELISRIVPPALRKQWDDEERATILARRREAAERFDRETGEVPRELADIDARLTAALADERKKFAALEQCRRKTHELQAARAALTARRDTARRKFEAEMRGLAPRSILDALVARVDKLLNDAVPE